MYLFPSWRKNRYSFLKANEDWWTVLIVDLLAIPGTIIAHRLGKFIYTTGRSGQRLDIITPNAISSASFFIFYLGIALLFVRPHDNAYFTACFFVSCLLDCIDGKLARIRGEESRLGVIVDAFFDMLNHGLGLILVGVALSIKVDSPYPLIIILPYSLYLGCMHVNCITNAIYPAPKQEVSNEAKKRTKWQLFCDKRGLAYKIYTDVEVIYVVILLIGINLQNPTWFLFIGIYLQFILRIWRKLRKVAHYSLLCKN